MIFTSAVTLGRSEMAVIADVRVKSKIIKDLTFLSERFIKCFSLATIQVCEHF